MRLDEDLIKH